MTKEHKSGYEKITKYRKYCDACDGTGWNEGGVTLKTNCKNCGGTGIIIVSKVIDKATWRKDRK